MDTLRAKQNMEILDVWSNLHKQVAGRTRKQVAVFPDTHKPKTERDLTVEVNVDKAIEGINKTIEQKLGSLEFFLQNVGRFNDPKFSQSVIQAIDQSTNTGDVIPLYNSIARSAHTVGLSSESQQVVRVQLQALMPGLEAITYGLLEAVKKIVGFMNSGAVLGDDADESTFPKSLTGASLDFLRTYAVYQFIKQQADKDNRGMPELLTVEALNTEFRNSFENLPQSDITMIKERIPNANWLLSSGMKNVPDFPINDYEGRLKALEEELGFEIPGALRGALLKLPINKQKDALATLKNELAPGVKGSFTRKEEELIRSVESLAKEVHDENEQLRQLMNQAQMLNEEIDALERGVQLNPEQAEEHFHLVPEAPLEPEMPDYLDYYPDDSAYDRMMDDYRSAMRLYRERREEYEQIVGHNMFIKELLIPDQNGAERDEQIREKEQMMEELRPEAQKLVNSIRAKRERVIVMTRGNSRLKTSLVEALRIIVNKALPEDDRIGKQDSVPFNPAKRSKEFRDIVVGLPDAPPNLYSFDSDEEREEEESGADDDSKYDGSGKGGRLATRGRATLRKNYGFRDSDSESSDSDCEDKGDVLDFDDRRNEHYYTRPAGR